jgi:L-malate glycosyltransferase
MKIAFVYDALYPYLKGGGEKRYHELATRLSGRHEVHHLSWRFWDGEPDPTLDGIALHGIGSPGRFYGDDGKRTVAEAAAFAARLVPALLRERFDVIDCSATPYLPLSAAWLASRLTGTPLVATWHEFWGEYWESYLPHRPAVARVARRLEASCAGMGDARVAVSPFTGRRLMEANGGTSVRVIGNGVSLDQIAAVAPSRRRSDVIFVGRLIEDKQVDLLLRAIARLREAVTGLRLQIVGDGPQRSSLEALAQSLGIGDRVCFTGSVPGDEVIALMKSSKVLAFPSRREGFGITVIEAQACGLVPVVVESRHSAASTLIHDGIDGIVCGESDESLAAAIGGLLNDRTRLKEMSARARAAVSTWDWDAIALQMEVVYRQTLAQRAVGRRRSEARS